ncbi:MAG: gluconate 2-dehydrogenase subunit 3 family protein [Saprospiraceae bacterium]|nr:gluconate 2-dehydrogenase subunit 3 family protein [Saprospiraceae bacterium]MCB0577662.1 gluconate 2-dehydrogenase subunit 3 family protein [Saprospiraceae bacterium]
MNRRELLQRTSLVIGGSLLGADSLLAKKIDWDALDDLPEDFKNIGIFSKAQVKLMNEVADTIIPDTSTPGAKAAKVGQFMAVIVSDCYDPGDQKRFLDGLTSLEAAGKTKYGKSSFRKLSPLQRNELLTALDQEQKAVEKSKKKEEPSHYFRVFKDLVLWGYFTSEIGATQALRFLEYPGKYTTVDYKKGERNWGGY